jgi:peptidyl-prolyl cis-trans isomerase B (cyclophilin B)
MSLTANFDTSRGQIKVELFADKAPLTVANFVNLVQRGFYDGLNFHRVIADFMIQGGCPDGRGTGGPGYRFEDETKNGVAHQRGSLSMANAGPNTNGSQFFITHIKTDWLDGRHTVFGQVLEGQDVVDAVAQGDTINKITIDGDTAAVLAAKADRVDEWNKVLGA